jgi:hypothetical protein
MKNRAAVLLVLLAACGGSDKTPDPAARTFTYGAAVTPTATEAAAATAGEASTSDGTALQTSTATDPATAGSSIVSLPDVMASEAWSSSSMALQGSPSTARTVATLGGPAAVMAYGFDDPSCLTIVPGASITYSSCTVTLGTGMVRVNGKITVSGATLGWDLTSRLDDATTGYSMTATVHATGALTFGATTVNGQARSDTSATVTGGGTTMSAAYTTLADVALELQRDPFCVTGGTLELRRVWTKRPAGAGSTGEYADQGLKFTWQGCGTVLVQHSI